MKIRSVVSTLSLVMVSLFFLTAVTASRAVNFIPRHKGNFQQGEVLVKLGSQALRAGSQKFASRYQAQSIRSVNRSGLQRMKLKPGESVEAAVAKLSRDPDVEFAQPNYRYYATATPNDTSYANLWGLNNTAQTVPSASYATNNPGLAGKDIGAQEGWDLNTDCSSKVVAVIDTGVNYNHTELDGNMWPGNGYDFVDNDTDPMDLNGHGTHVAGVIGAEGNNASGVTGVCWDASIMAVRVLDASGSGLTSDVVSGVDWAVANGADVINMSLGGSSYDSALAASVLAASNAGVVLVVAAGNDGTNNNTIAQYPCNLPGANLVCVAALDQRYSLATFSNYGNNAVDVGAPGTNILSSWHGTETETTDDFSAGWAGDATWAAGTYSTYDIFSNPATWNGTSTTYANSLDAKQHKTFNLSAADSAVLSFYAFIDTESSADFFRVGYHTAGGDAFTAGTTLDASSGSTGGSAQNFTYDISACTTATCRIGFQLTSNASITNYGVAVLLFTITSTVLDTTSYNTINGTSMATPYAAGIAASVFAYHPNYTAADVVAALKNGGTAAAALTTKTSTGKAVNLEGSLNYLGAPTGVTATVQ